jgi:protein gp37
VLLFDLIRQTPNLDWLLLTKRIGKVRELILEAGGISTGSGALSEWIGKWGDGSALPANVWLGATVVNQQEAERDIPRLLRAPAAVRFLSIEPMLGPIGLGADLGLHGGPGQIDWVIVGGESGAQARPMNPDWALAIRDACRYAGVPFLFKQWGEWAPTMLGNGEWDHHKVGKVRAGRLLDGKTHDGYPTP